MRTLHSVLLRLLPVVVFAIGSIAAVTHPYWQAHFPYTHDGENHLARFANYKIALREGQVPPRIGPNLHNRYGYPVFNYNYPFANIVSLPFSVLRVNYEIIFSLQVIIAVSLGWIGVWLALMYSKVQLPIRSVLASIYITAPYLTTALFFRGNIGEVWIYSLLPWLWVSCVWISTYHAHSLYPIYAVASVGIWVSFLLAHNLGVLISIPLFILFASTVFKKNWVLYKKASILGICAVGFSLWFWLPALVEKQVVTLDAVDLSSQYSTHFLHSNDIFLAPQRFGFSHEGIINSAAPSLGMPLTVISIVVLAVGIKKMFSLSYAFIAAISVFFASIWMSTDSSIWLWSRVDQLALIQFPWRWLLISPIALLFGCSLIVLELKPFRTIVTWILCIALCIQVGILLRSYPADTFHKTNADYEAFTMTTSTQNENMPRTFTYQDIANWQPAPTLELGSGSVRVDFWSGSRRTYTVTVLETAIIAEPTMYFPGWETYVDNTKIDLEANIQDIAILEGRIGFELQPGTHQVTSVFTQNTWPRLVGNGMFFATTIFFIAYIFYLKRYPYHKVMHTSHT